MHEEYARFEERPIRDFIPLFVERNAKAELSKLGNAELSKLGNAELSKLGS